MSTIAGTTFKITNTKLYVPIVTLSSKGNVKLVKLLEEGFKRPVYWNEYQTKIESRNLDNSNLTRFPLDASFQGVRRLLKLLEEGFKRPVYWNEYLTKIETRNLDNNNLTRFPLEARFQGVRRLFALAFDNTDIEDKKVERNSSRKYFLPRVNITNYNVLIDGKKFYDQPINDQIKKYGEITKTAKGQGDD